MRQLIFNFCILVWMAWLTVYIVNNQDNIHNVEFELKLNNPDFTKNLKANVNNMLLTCRHYNLKYPEIVTAQAVLESGNFKSKLFKEYNNPFGLYNSSKKEYFKFRHFSEAVIAYKNMVEYKYKGGDYYEFLEKLPYANDSKYISKVKAIESNLNHYE